MIRPGPFHLDPMQLQNNTQATGSPEYLFGTPGVYIFGAGAPFSDQLQFVEGNRAAGPGAARGTCMGSRPDQNGPPPPEQALDATTKWRGMDMQTLRDICVVASKCEEATAGITDPVARVVVGEFCKMQSMELPGDTSIFIEPLHAEIAVHKLGVKPAADAIKPEDINPNGELQRDGLKLLMKLISSKMPRETYPVHDYLVQAWEQMEKVRQEALAKVKEEEKKTAEAAALAAEALKGALADKSPSESGLSIADAVETRDSDMVDAPAMGQGGVDATSVAGSDARAVVHVKDRVLVLIRGAYQGVEGTVQKLTPSGIQAQVALDGPVPEVKNFAVKNLQVLVPANAPPAATPIGVPTGTSPAKRQRVSLEQMFGTGIGRAKKLID